MVTNENRIRLNIFLLALLASFGWASNSTVQAQPPPPEPSLAYRLTDLNTLTSTASEAFDINNAGQIVGYETFSGVKFATSFSPRPVGGNVSIGVGTARAINNLPGGGLIVGDSPVGGATLWAFGKATPLSPPPPPGTIPGGPASEALGVNDQGDIVGYALTNQGQTHATLFGNNPLNPGPNFDLGLGTLRSMARAVNNSDAAVGNATVPLPESTPGCGNPCRNPTAQRASFFPRSSGPVMTLDLGLLPEANVLGSSDAFNINNDGQIVGNSFTRPPNHLHATLFGGPNFPNLDLGTIDGGYDSTAFAINDQSGGGLIVGESHFSPSSAVMHAALWGFGGQVFDLNTQIDPNDPLFGQVELHDAQSINNAGAIVANGTLRGRTHAFLLIPERSPLPEPNTLALLVAGIAGLGLIVRLRSG